MRWLAGGLYMAVLAAQICWCVPVAKEDSAALRSLPEQDALDTLPISESNDRDTLRDKRTLGFIRQNYPGLARIIDSKIQMITRWLFRVVGRLVLRGGILGGGGGGGGGNSSSGGNRRVSIVLPTFPPDDEDEDTEEVPTPSTDANPDENQLSGAESQVYESRVAAPSGFFDLQPAASNGDALAVAEPADDAVAEGSEDSDEARNKRLTSFGGGSAGGSGGGSGNFIFDIIRNTADRAARAAGTVYRLVAGTESLGLGLGLGASTTTSSTSKTATTTTRARANRTTTATVQTNSTNSRALFTGSSNAETTDDGSQGSGAAEAQVEKDDGYQAGIPGPITRLFIIANRGIANLVQDLILRLAQTSERIVNFKARLITSII